MEELVGRTSLVRLVRFSAALSLKTPILAKLEGENPTGSSKDRALLRMLRGAEERGEISRGDTLVLPTSGNAGISLAALCACRGYRAVLFLPENMSLERRRLLSAYGAAVVLTPKGEGMAGAVRRAERYAEAAGAYLMRQFESEENAAGHYFTTGPELWEDTEGKIDVLAAGVGSGGTLMGAGRYLKEKKPSFTLAAVEPSASPVLSGGKAGAHEIAGIGAGFVPPIFDVSLPDVVLRISSREAKFFCRLLAAKEGLLAGVSSGAALGAAARLAAGRFVGKTVVAILPDTGERYLSEGLFP